MRHDWQIALRSAAIEYLDGIRPTAPAGRM